MEYKEPLRNARTILVIDWPSKEVPEALALAGFATVVRGGPGPQDFASYAREGDSVVRRPCGAPAQIDLIYAHRPLTELPHIIATAKTLHASVIWTQSGLRSDGSRDPRGCWVPEAEHDDAEELVRAAGLTYLSAPYIVDAVRELGSRALDSSASQSTGGQPH
jgi:predicted CoA-binding protein